MKSYLIILLMSSAHLINSMNTENEWLKVAKKPSMHKQKKEAAQRKKDEYEETFLKTAATIIMSPNQSPTPKNRNQKRREHKRAAKIAAAKKENARAEKGFSDLYDTFDRELFCLSNDGLI